MEAAEEQRKWVSGSRSADPFFARNYFERKLRSVLSKAKQSAKRRNPPPAIRQQPMIFAMMHETANNAYPMTQAIKAAAATIGKPNFTMATMNSWLIGIPVFSYAANIRREVRYGMSFSTTAGGISSTSGCLRMRMKYLMREA